MTTETPSTENRKPKQGCAIKFIRGLAISVPILILFVYIVTILIESWVESKVTTEIRKQFDGHVTVSELDVSVWMGNITVQDLKLQVDPQNTDESYPLLRISSLKIENFYASFRDDDNGFDVITINRPTAYLEKNRDGVINYEEFERIIDSLQNNDSRQEEEESDISDSVPTSENKIEPGFFVDLIEIENPRLIMAHNDDGVWKQITLEFDDISGTIQKNESARAGISARNMTLRADASSTAPPITAFSSLQLDLESNEANNTTTIEQLIIDNPEFSLNYDGDGDTQIDLIKDLTEALFPDDEDEDESEEGDGVDDGSEDENERDSQTIVEQFEIRNGTFRNTYEETPLGRLETHVEGISLSGKINPNGASEIQLTIESVLDLTTQSRDEAIATADSSVEQPHLRAHINLTRDNAEKIERAAANVRLQNFPARQIPILTNQLPESEDFPFIIDGHADVTYDISVTKDFVTINSEHQFRNVIVSEDNRSLLKKFLPSGYPGLLAEIAGKTGSSPRISVQLDVPRTTDSFLPYLSAYNQAFDDVKLEAMSQISAPTESD